MDQIQRTAPTRWPAYRSYSKIRSRCNLTEEPQKCVESPSVQGNVAGARHINPELSAGGKKPGWPQFQAIAESNLTDMPCANIAVGARRLA
ncbi:hypothetical protein ACQKGL_29810 [Ensifer adhaerens]|uniref:hypothetical protein n=1 Tax=Ensifer adhaerens TaxID=106592 RepID=UPI003CFF674C